MSVVVLHGHAQARGREQHPVVVTRRTIGHEDALLVKFPAATSGEPGPCRRIAHDSTMVARPEARELWRLG